MDIGFTPQTPSLLLGFVWYCASFLSSWYGKPPTGRATCVSVSRVFLSDFYVRARSIDGVFSCAVCDAVSDYVSTRSPNWCRDRTIVPTIRVLKMVERRQVAICRLIVTTMVGDSYSSAFYPIIAKNVSVNCVFDCFVVVSTIYGGF